MRKVLHPVRGDRGSIGAAVIFTLFTAVVLAAVAGTVISTMNLMSTVSERSSTGTEAIILQERIQGSGENPGEQCFAGTCVNGTLEAGDGSLSVTVDGAEGYSKTRHLKEASGALISGFDASGNPIWSDGMDTTLRVFASLALFPGHACALDEAGAAWCWGENSRGQLGDGSTSSSQDPVRVSGNRTFTALAGSVSGTCALDDTGAAWCWGAGDHGRLGNASVSDSAVPVRAGSGTYVSLAVSGTTSCALAGGALDCWGLNAGNGDTKGSRSPVKVPGTWSSVVMDDERTCALGSTGKASCWASSTGTNTGTGGEGSSADPAEVNGSRTYSRLYAGSGTFCGLTPAGDAWCFGSNDSGQLGDGTTVDADIPVKVTGGHRFDSLAPGSGATCGLSAGSIWCWGGNSSGQLGNGGTAASSSPVRSSAGTASSLSSGTTGWFCARVADAVQCWGENSSGQASPGSASAVRTPAPVSGIGAATGVHTAGSTACILDARRAVHCWGQLAGSPASPQGVGRTEVTPGKYTGYVRSHQ